VNDEVASTDSPYIFPYTADMIKRLENHLLIINIEFDNLNDKKY